MTHVDDSQKHATNINFFVTQNSPDYDEKSNVKYSQGPDVNEDIYTPKNWIRERQAMKY